MATLEAVGLSTATYTGDTAVEPDGDEMNGEETGFDIGGEEVGYGDKDYNGDDIDNGDDINDCNEENNSDNNSFSNSFPTHGKRLMILCDCETTGGSHYNDHIIEVAATVIIPDNVSTTITEFSNLCRTSKHISSFGM